MSDSWSSRLSDYLDDELEPTERRDLEVHLRDCVACRDEVSGLRRVLGLYDTLRDRGPERDLWPAICARLSDVESSRPSLLGLLRRLPRLTVGLIGAVSVALLLITATELSPPVDRPPVRTTSTPAEDGPSIAQEYETAVTALRGALSERELTAEMDTRLNADLDRFDEAIRETRSALAESPNDPDLRYHLVRTLRSEVEFLRRAESTLANVGG